MTPSTTEFATLAGVESECLFRSEDGKGGEDEGVGHGEQFLRHCPVPGDEKHYDGGRDGCEDVIRVANPENGGSSLLGIGAEHNVS